MIKVKAKKLAKRGFKLEIRNHNGELMNHFYNHKHDAKRAWENFVKQIKEGKIKWVDE